MIYYDFEEGNGRSDRFDDAYITRLLALMKVDCIMCSVKPPRKATVHTSAGDFVCETCRDEFEDALDKGDTE